MHQLQLAVLLLHVEQLLVRLVVGLVRLAAHHRAQDGRPRVDADGAAHAQHGGPDHAGGLVPDLGGGRLLGGSLVPGGSLVGGGG